MGQWRAQAEIPATVLAPRAARHTVAALLPGWQLEPLVDDALLVVSELVTNAVRHAPGQAGLELELVAHADRLRITVTDGSAIRPVVAHLQHTRPSGRGLHIVQALAARWGVDHLPDGKRVWAELATPHPGRHLTLT